MPVEMTFATLGGGFAELLVSSATTKGIFSCIVGTVEPGGGPPPHIHNREDEFFFPLEGSFELFDGEQWTPLAPTGKFARRNHVHTFRNSGSTTGKLLAFATGANFDEFLPKLAALKVPEQMAEVVAISAAHGISYVRPKAGPDAAKGQEQV